MCLMVLNSRLKTDSVNKIIRHEYISCGYFEINTLPTIQDLINDMENDPEQRQCGNLDHVKCV